jgi:hypothetical protein
MRWDDVGLRLDTMEIDISVSVSSLSLSVVPSPYGSWPGYRLFLTTQRVQMLLYVLMAVDSKF